MKHTPGPWTYSRHCLKEAQGHIFMANARPGDGCTIELTGAAAMSQERLDANGLLMAAAPRLLETMQRFFAAKDSDEHHHAMVAMEEAIREATKQEDSTNDA